MRTATILMLFMTLLANATPPIFSNIKGQIVSCDSTGGRFYRWTVEATFDLDGDNSIRYRIFPGLRILDPKRILPDEGFYFNYQNVSGDTAVFPGKNYKLRFTAKDTCGYDSVRVKLTAWDRQGWPPFPNRSFFGRHNGLALDIRNAPLHQNSLNFLLFIKTNAGTTPTSNFGFVQQTYGVFRTMADHPRKKLVTCTKYCYAPDTAVPIPFPTIALGDPSEPSMVNCSGDCHMTIVDVENWMAYEFFRAKQITAGSQDWDASIAIYDLNAESYTYRFPKLWTPFGTTTKYRYRGLDGGANVSGMSFAVWALSAEEVLAGEIQHAIGSNFWIQANYSVYPATKGDISSALNAPPIGMKIRLKPTVDIIKLSSGLPDSTAIRVILRCFQKYGIVNAQTAESNTTFHLLYSNLPGSSFETTVSPNFRNMLKGLKLDLVRDFEVVDWEWQIQQYEKYPKDL